MKNVIQDEQVGDLRGFGYRVFMEWMKDERGGKQQISPSAMRGIQHYMSEFQRGNKLKR